MNSDQFGGFEHFDQVDDIDEVHELDPVHQVDHKDEYTDSYMAACFDSDLVLARGSAPPLLAQGNVAQGPEHKVENRVRAQGGTRCKPRSMRTRIQQLSNQVFD